ARTPSAPPPGGRRRGRAARSRRLLDQAEPVEAARAEGEQVRQLADRREAGLTEHLLGHQPGELCQLELDRLRAPGQVVDAEDGFLLPAPDVGEDPRVRRLE